MPRETRPEMTSELMKQPAITEPESRIEAAQQGSLSIVDRSIRIPVLIFFGSSVAWLIVASLFWLLTASQIYTPTAWWTFPGIAWLSFGRAYPVFLNCLVYGWATSAGIGTGIWLLSRFTDVPLRDPFYPILAAIIWNVGLGTGVLSILMGFTTGKELLEFPSYSAFILFLGLVIISLWAVMIIWNRKSGTAYVSQWYLLGAFLWFAWIYATANIALVFASAPGVAQPAINWWYTGTLVDLWLTPIALAVGYYLIPKITGRRIYSYRLALLSFWGLALFGGWTGVSRLVGGPLPAWMITASIVAKVLMLIPVLAVAVNFHRTMEGDYSGLRENLPLRFVVIGAMVYTAYSFEGSIISIRSIAQFTQFSLVASVHTQLGIFGFCSMILFGALYYTVPRLLGRRWPYPKLITSHFWFIVVGFGLLFFDLTIGGLIQGFGLEDPQIPMKAVNDLIQPFLAIQNIAVLLLVIGNLGFAVGFILMLLISAPARLKPAAVNAEDKASEKATAEVSIA
jgi:cytochrome c oxidase cbb3-type subunit I